MVYIKRDRERDDIWGDKSSPALGACYYDNRTILLDYRQGQSRYLIQSPNCLNKLRNILNAQAFKLDYP